MALLRLLVETFVGNTSMRGFMKLYKTRHVTLKLLWTVYLVSMISLLCTASYYLVTHYLSFFVTVQQSERLQDITPLPSIAVCSERPIGDEAARLWANGSVTSPLQLHLAMRRSMRRAYLQSNGGKRKGKFFAAKDLFYADKLSTYFQNLGVRDGRRVGVQPHDLLLFCIMRHSTNNNPSISHDEICKLSLRWVRHPQYMNCYDITIVGGVSEEVSSVTLILQSGLAPASEFDLQLSQVFDLFTQSIGMRIALHDPGSFPNIDEEGVSVGLRRNTHLRYNLVRHQRLNLNLDHSSCLSEEEVAGRPALTDFDERYSYTFFACMSQAIGQLILDKCGCMSAAHMVNSTRAAGAPFCDSHNEEDAMASAKRLDCVRNMRVKEDIQRLRATSCLHRCEYNRYQVQISSSEWIPTQWQLKLILSISRAWDTAAAKSAEDEERREAIRKLQQFVLKDAIRHKFVNMSDLDLDRLTLVTVSRSSYNTVLKSEALQITLSTLLAQIGGMGSLTIGLTLTVLFEIVEFVFLLLRSQKPQQQQQQQQRQKKKQKKQKKQKMETQAEAQGPAEQLEQLQGGPDWR